MIPELKNENINFIFNVNNIVGQIGPIMLNDVLSIITTAIFLLQHENKPRHISNLQIISNQMLRQYEFARGLQLSKSEIFGLLYYIQQIMETITMNDSHKWFEWSVKEDVYNSLMTKLFPKNV